MEKLIVKLDFEVFPEEYTSRGANRSPPIRVEGLLPEIRSLAIMVMACPEDGASRVAWVTWNLPAVPQIPEGFPPGGEVDSPLHAVQGENDFGTIGYRGPAPDAGKPEAYLFRVYALDREVEIKAGSTWDEMVMAIRGSIKQVGEAIAFAEEQVAC
ncbi:MAG TPA: YbhB/YbcL family Raf kinase inhibitor-like protein [Methanoculleus sp.]|nr:YbhB/YbcL family Raf kinase inhibitor-like protein [Methanoculleus sp.]